MKRIAGLALMVISLLLIAAAVIQIVSGGMGMWAPAAIGVYVLHPATMIVGLCLAAGKAQPAPAADEEGGE
jgi:hypothetical protein